MLMVWLFVAKGPSAQFRRFERYSLQLAYLASIAWEMLTYMGGLVGAEYEEGHPVFKNNWLQQDTPSQST